MCARTRCRCERLLVTAILALTTAASCVYSGEPALRAVLIADGLADPVSLNVAPDENDRLFIVERAGTIVILDRSTGEVRPTPFLDITAKVRYSGEHGLLDIGFDASFAKNGRFYINYNQVGAGDTIIARYETSGDPNVADPNSELVLKTIPQTMPGHTAGQLRFGPDGFLYVAAGDGSTATDADSANHSQSLQSLHGKLLRLDVDNPPTFLPPSNPFMDDPKALPEIWALGLRNPWRFSFDRVTGDLYIGDVGWADREEVDFQPAVSAGGENYGWRCMEASLCTGLEGCTCNEPDITLPIVERTHELPDDFCAVIGGFVYRGCALPDFEGRYLYGDFCGASFRSFRVIPDGGGGFEAVDEIDHTAELNPDGAIFSLTTFGEDADGELYFATRAGTVWKIVAACLADLNGTGTVDVADVLAILAAWGPCAACPEDLDGSGAVDFGDVLVVLAAWGPCPE